MGMATTRTYAGRTADDRRQARRVELIEAAIGLMSEHGVGGLTVRDVASAAGVSPRYIYESFDDLDDLRARTFDHTASEVVSAALDAVTAAAPALAARVEALLTTLLTYADEHPGQASLVLTDSFGDPTLAARRREMSRSFASAFGLFVRLHLPEPISEARLELATTMLVGATAEVVVARLHDGAPAFSPETVTDMRDLFLAMLSAV